MGPTNVALVKLFRAEQALREAQGRLDAATKNVRVQERKVNDLAERVKLAQAKLRELQAKGGEFELDIKTREARIEKLRSQQQNANNNKEYQTFLIEISTEKVDRGKSEDELLAVMEQIETSQAELKDLTTHFDSDSERLTQMRAEIGGRVSQLQAEVDALRVPREAAAEAVPPRFRQHFDRLAERFEGEALSALSKPDRRREEYLCSACMMDLVADVYNRLHTRDDLICCTSCGRILFIPEDLPPEVAINSRGKTEAAKEGSYGAAAPRSKKSKAVERLEPAERRAKGKLGTVLTAAQGESVKIALDADLKPLECDVIVDDKPQGIYKGKAGDHLQRIIELRMQEAGLKGTVEVREKAPPAATTDVSANETVSPTGPAAVAPEHAAADHAASVPQHSAGARSADETATDSEARDESAESAQEPSEQTAS